MLRCKDVAERASALIDGELGVIDTLQMRFHLAMCKGCHAFIAQMRATRDLTQMAPQADTPQNDETARISAIFSKLQSDKQSGV